MQTTSENDIVVDAPCAFGCPGHRPANGCTVVVFDCRRAAVKAPKNTHGYVRRALKVDPPSTCRVQRAAKHYLG